jgi:four helix bundle protein
MLETVLAEKRSFLTWHSACSSGGMTGVRRFTQLRAWQACVAYKKAVYAICEVGPLATNLKKRSQLEDSVAGPPAHVAEGYGRFNPADFARFVVMARSSLMESQNHLLDLVDAKYITEAKRQELDALAQEALREVTGLLEYLQSPEALRNARRARERRIASRQDRHSRRAAEKAQGANAEPRTSNTEQRTEPEREHEPSTENPEE